MENRYIYRFIKSSWGIYIDLLAEALPYSTDFDDAKEVNPGVWLHNASATNLTEEDQGYIELGLTLVNAQLQTQTLIPLPLLIRIKEVGLVLTDFQPEGFVCAIAGWAGNTFGFPIPNFSVRFDKPQNRYVFDFSDH